MLWRSDKDGTYTISSGRVWLPGCYADKRAATLAFALPDSTLQRLQDESIAAAVGKEFAPIPYETVLRAYRERRTRPDARIAFGGGR